MRGLSFVLAGIENRFAPNVTRHSSGLGGDSFVTLAEMDNREVPNRFRRIAEGKMTPCTNQPIPSGTVNAIQP